MVKNKKKYLTKKLDKLYQIKLIKEKPRSIVSGKPTEVIHHYIPKSQSNNLRYDYDNGVPLTNDEHFAHHTKGDPHIQNTIEQEMGQDWVNDLQKRRYTIRKYGIKELESMIKEFDETR